MELGEREHEGASLVLGRSDALPAHLQDIIEVSKVQTPKLKRRQGLMTDLLMQVCDEADRERVVLLLAPEGEEWLRDFYARFGFATIQTEPEVLMARPPRIEHGRTLQHAVSESAGRPVAVSATSNARH